MSRVGIPGPPVELQTLKTITIQCTNPKFDNMKLINSFIGIWPEIDRLIKDKTGRFFKMASMEAVVLGKSSPERCLQLNFKTYKGSPISYQGIVDSLQEYFPEHGIRAVYPIDKTIDDIPDNK